MSDTLQVMYWSVGHEEPEISSSNRLRLPYLPGKESFSARLAEVVTRLDSNEELYEAFPVKKPIPSWWAWWFGFWMDSPLTQRQCRVLCKVFTELSKKSPLYREHIEPFLSALQQGRDTNAQIHVRLAPPGHVDLGWATTFAHCPHCKAEAPVERWKEKYSDVLIECPICAFSYSPAQTYSAQEWP